MKGRHFRDEQKGAFFLIVIFLIIVTVSVILAVALRTDAVAEKIASDQVIRLLLVIDEGEGKENKALLSNVLVYYPVSKKAMTINIPGNTGAIYQSLGRVDRIDDVYTEKGIDIYKKEIEKLLGIPIPFSLVIKMEDFIRLTDMLGGLRVFIPAPVDVVSSEGERWLLPSGAVNLDGDKIYMYLKYCFEDETDSDVQERYQNVVTSFFTTLHDKKAMVFRKQVFREFNGIFNMNLSDSSDVYTLLSLIADMDSESIGRQTVAGKIRIVDGQQLLFPLNNGEFIKEAVKQSTNMLISNSGALASRIYVLEIKNGTTVQGLAHNTAILFQNASYDVLSAVNADSNDYENTVIIDHIGNRGMAAMVGEFIRCTNIVDEEVDFSSADNDAAANVDFTIILGKDFDGRYVRPSRTE